MEELAEVIGELRLINWLSEFLLGAFGNGKNAHVTRQLTEGSVMYLFRGEFGCMLYTGDFRREKPSNTVDVGRTMLLNALKNEKLDILCLDNTYCNPRSSFTSRKVAAREIVEPTINGGSDLLFITAASVVTAHKPTKSRRKFQIVATWYRLLKTPMSSTYSSIAVLLKWWRWRIDPPSSNPPQIGENPNHHCVLQSTEKEEM
ncbi:5 exonuclease Apollo [Olea europaea subsp. europaea]|uniref:5 exonuclease Apollo n=1 Tax=Olea europaea subsp. europaea TaxID=158383 RepID=A0A8S0SBV8_OLEEU|nr:5 exonuclease Apollo [Olea europaea subsp. europaea]